MPRRIKLAAKYCALIIVLLVNVNWLKDNSPSEIEINNATNELIAPAGSDYQWFFNNQMIEKGIARKLTPGKSGKYKVVFRNKSNILKEQEIAIHLVDNKIIRIFIIGDSTVQSYGASKYPLAGWGQVLKHFFSDTLVEVTNRAIGGRSSRSFYEEGRWNGANGVLNELDSNSYVFIQFGHNDRDWTKDERFTTPDSMKYFLRIYVNDSRSKGAIPVLVSPMNMNAGAENIFTRIGADYRGAMEEVAVELDVPFLDLNMRSYDFYQIVGQEYAKYFIHLGLEPGQYPNYPTGSTDFWTHYHEMGALTMARLITEEIMDKQTNAELEPLYDALTPLYDVHVALSEEVEGMVTLPGQYPAGATITLLAKLNDNNVVNQWVDSDHLDTLEGNPASFIMGAKNYNFTGIVTDCFGTPGGSAEIDRCGVCSGGETGIKPCSEKVKFVDFCETNANVQILLKEELYDLVINTDSIENAFVSQSFNVTKTDTFLFEVLYNNSTQDETLNIYVNDALSIENLELEEDALWNILEFGLPLNKGQNNIRIQTTSQSGGVLLNHIAYYSDEIEIKKCNREIIEREGYFYQEDSLIVIEAENYNNLTLSKDDGYWTRSLFDNASGDVIIAPAETSYGSASDAETDATIAHYNVDFPFSGNYNIWARVFAFNESSDSYHLGLNGEAQIEKIDLFFGSKVYNEFTWLNVADKTLNITEAGIQSLDLFYREPNLIVDKIILTQDLSYTPEELGPNQTYVASDTTTTSVNHLKIDKNTIQALVYPNPATDEINVEYNLLESQQVKIRILDLDGKSVFDLYNGYQENGKHLFSWGLNNSNSGNLPNGVYLLSIKGKNSTFVEKVLIQQ